MHKLWVNGREYPVEDGVCLSEALQACGVMVDQPCGGRGVCGKCRVTVNGREELACRYTVRSDVTVTVPQPGEILTETGVRESGRMTERLAFALDVGTTTLALALVSQEDGQVVRVLTATNPQRAYGADVMSRIAYCQKNGPQELQRVLVEEVNRLVRAFALPVVDALYVAGNTTMLHLLFGVDCSAMGVAPYTPEFLESRRAAAETLGIAGVREVISLPSLAAFVGADLVAGLHYVGLPERGKYRLLVDLGTNAEIVLYAADTLLCTAAAAGPCFEGANISCGMSALPGAVYAYGPDGAKTVEDAPACGLCGTGLVDVMAVLLADGTVDETGYMEDGAFSVADGVELTQEDVRQFQLAKSAVYAAIRALMAKAQVTYSAIDRLYISGGFSAGMNIPNAVACGLLPGELAGRCTALKNTSLLGTVKYAAGDRDVSAWDKPGSYVDLSADPLFSDLFIEHMLF